MVSRNIYVLIVLLFLITPLYAVDLSGYEGYITPKFGASINNTYQYTSDNVIWGDASPSFEKNGGYYNIFEDNEEVTFQIWVNSNFHGELYLILWYENKDGEYEYSEYLIFSGVAGDFEGYYFSKTLEMPSNAYGDCFYQWVLSSGYWIGASDNKWSKEYTFFTKRGLNTNWKQKRSLSISSAEKLKDGVAQINLNKSYMENVHIEYTLDSSSGNLYSYSGTLTDLVFTNEDYTKAYAYFVNEYEGGYYEFNRQASNNTIIDLWINEDINNKQIYMFYDYNFISRAYIYGSTVGYQHDRPNNPYTVHQIFNDYRWNENQYRDYIDKGSFYFNRGEYIYKNGDINSEPIIYNNVSQINYKSYIGWVTFYLGATTLIGDWLIMSHSDSHNSNQILKNSTLSTTYFDYSAYNNKTINVYINNSNINVKIDNNVIRNLPENKTKLGKITHVGINSYSTESPSRIYPYYEIPYINIFYDISNTSATDYAYINFLNMLEYESFINDLWIGGYIEVDNSGLFLCEDSEKNILGSVNINKDETLESFNIIFPYTMTNKTKFLNTNEFNYSCSFISGIGGFEVKSNNLTINFTTNKIFLSSIKPIHQNNYSSSYIAYKINSELNYTGIQTDFSLRTNKINCLQTNIYDGKCLIYNLINEADYYNLSSINKTFNYNSIKEFPVNSWYQQYFQFCRNEICLNTPSRLFHIYKEETNNNEEIEDYIEWENPDLISDENYRNNLMWKNPLLFLGSSIYYLAANTITMDNTAKMFISWIIFLIFNFYTLIFLIFGLFYFKYENVYVALIVSLGCISLFTFMNWTPHLLTYILILLIIYIIGKFLSKE